MNSTYVSLIRHVCLKYDIQDSADALAARIDDLINVYDDDENGLKELIKARKILKNNGYPLSEEEDFEESENLNSRKEKMLTSLKSKHVNETYKRELEPYVSFLESKGYKFYGKTGFPSTVYFYYNAIKNIMKKEHISSVEQLKKNITQLVAEYDKKGSKSSFGKKGNGVWLNALKRFKEFARVENLAPKENALRDILVALSPEQIAMFKNRGLPETQPVKTELPKVIVHKKNKF